MTTIISQIVAIRAIRYILLMLYISFWQSFFDKLFLIPLEDRKLYIKVWTVLILKSPSISKDVIELNKSLKSLLNLRKGPSLNFAQTGYDKIKFGCFEHRCDCFCFSKFCRLAVHKR